MLPSFNLLVRRSISLRKTWRRLQAISSPSAACSSAMLLSRLVRTSSKLCMNWMIFTRVTKPFADPSTENLVVVVVTINNNNNNNNDDHDHDHHQSERMRFEGGGAAAAAAAAAAA